MTRGDLVKSIALEYVEYQRQYAARVAAGEVRYTPLSHDFARTVALRAIRSGDYKIGRPANAIDWGPHARDARKLLPWARRALDQYEEAHA